VHIPALVNGPPVVVMFARFHAILVPVHRAASLSAGAAGVDEKLHPSVALPWRLQIRPLVCPATSSVASLCRVGIPSINVLRFAIPVTASPAM